MFLSAWCPPESPSPPAAGAAARPRAGPAAPGLSTAFSPCFAGASPCVLQGKPSISRGSSQAGWTQGARALSPHHREETCVPAAPLGTPGITCRRSGSQAQTQPRVFSTAAAQPPALMRAAVLLALLPEPGFAIAVLSSGGARRAPLPPCGEECVPRADPAAHRHAHASSWGILREGTPLYLGKLELSPPRSLDTCPALVWGHEERTPCVGEGQLPSARVGPH